jgi:hypothetical protein
MCEQLQALDERRGEEDDERDDEERGDGDSATAVNARGGWRVDFVTVF